MKWFKNSSLAAKLILTTMFGACSLLVVGFINFLTLKKVLTYYNHVASINLGSTEKLGEMRINSALLMTNLLEASKDFSEKKSVRVHLDEIKDNIKAYTSADQAFQTIEFVPGESEIYEPISKLWNKNKASVEKIVQTLGADEQVQAEGLSASMSEIVISLEQQVEMTNQLVEFQSGESKKWREKAVEVASLGQIVALSSIVFFFFLAIVVGILLSRAMSSRLRALANELNQGADEVAEASGGLSASSQELSQATTEQAASLEQTAASIEEMASMVAKNSENSRNTATLANQSQESARRGEQVVSKMITSMEEINSSNEKIMEAVNQSNREISEIIKVITEIGNKTKVINDIVFQTKLLSFNASVEAARAGEHGKGFAVVAEEVGNLAQMSGNAAKEISSMLEGSIHRVESIVRDTKNRVEKLIEEGHSKVEHGTSVAHQCGEVLHEIVENVGKVSGMSEEISAASDEQAKGVSEISKAMGQLDHVTQQNAQTSDSTADSSEHLSRQATQLRSAVVKLTLEIEGHRTQIQHHEHQFQSQKKSLEINEPQNPGLEKKSNLVQFKAKASVSKKYSLKAPHSPELTKAKGAKQSESQVVAGSGNVKTPSFDDSRFEDV